MEDICPNRSCTWNNIPSASTLTFDSAFPLSHLSGDGMSWSELLVEDATYERLISSLVSSPTKAVPLSDRD